MSPSTFFRKRCIGISRTLSFVSPIFTVLFISAVAALAEPNNIISSPNREGTGQFGFSLASIMDANGDGIGDVLVGANLEDPGSAPGNSGQAYLMSGLTGELLHVLLSASPVSSGNFGSSIASIPDLDGDQIEDVAVGAPGELLTANGVASGRVHVFSGASGLLIRSLDSPNPIAAGRFGTAVCGIDDINGDGSGDILVGAPFENSATGQATAGRAYLFSGADGQLLQGLGSPLSVANGQFGTSVSSVRNGGGLGISDLAIGAPFESAGRGRVHVMASQTGQLRHTLIPPNVSGHFGMSVAGIESVNGDPGNVGDILVGAPDGPSSTSSSAGYAQLFSGSDGLLIRNIPSANPIAQGQFGAGLRGTDDVDGDQVPDYLVGAPGNIIGGGNKGVVYHYSGADGHQIRTFVSKLTLATSNRFGASVVWIPATSEMAGGLIVAAPSDTSPPILTQAGRVYFFYEHDCNHNNVLDFDDIASNTSADCNENGTPDECEINGYLADCNENMKWDACDIFDNTSSDTNSDGIPDECDISCFQSLDCQSDGIDDLAQLEGNDCNANAIPDDCETNNAFMTRVSENATGEPAFVGTGFSRTFDAVMSADRRFVAFYSGAPNLAPGDVNGLVDVFLKDLETGEIRNIHRSPDGSPPTLSAVATIDMTPDGKFVAYLTITPGIYQLMLYDTEHDSVEHISRSITGANANNVSMAPALTADGNYVAFISSATDLVAGDSNGFSDVFRYDRQLNEMRRVSVGPEGMQGNGLSGFSDDPVMTSGQVSISADGRFVAFASAASNLVARDINNASDVFVHDCDTGITSMVSIATNGEQGAGPSGGSNPNWIAPFSIAMTPDGRFIVFDSMAYNLSTPNDTFIRQDLFLHDRFTRTTKRLVIGGSGGSTSLIGWPSISADGCFVSFATNLSGLAPGQHNGTDSFLNVFRYEVLTGAIELASRNEEGDGGTSTNSTIGTPRLSPDGQWIVFSSRSLNLSDDQPPSLDDQVYMRWFPKSPDCQADSILDACQLAQNDCNANGMPDDCECGCSGDINGDGIRAGSDIRSLTECLITGCTSNGCACADVSGDGTIDLADVEPFVDLLLSLDDSDCTAG